MFEVMKEERPWIWPKKPRLPVSFAFSGVMAQKEEAN